MSVSNNLILKGINYAYLNVKRNVYSVKCHTGEEKGMGGGNFNNKQARIPGTSLKWDTRALLGQISESVREAAKKIYIFLMARPLRPPPPELNGSRIVR